MQETTCDKCKHCTHVAEDEFYWCEICREYLHQIYALDPTLECDLFVEDSDDDITERS